MPFAQVHYPFENAEWFEHHYPGDFIVEYIGQTRGWFYTLHVLATALFDRPAFATCLAHGIVLGDDGQKMSQVAAQLPRRRRGLRPRRLRRDALVPDVVADPARRQPGRHRAGHPRRRAPGAAPAVEHLVLLLALRQRGRATTAQRSHRLRRPAGPLRAGQAARRRRRRRPRSWTSTTSRTPATSTRSFLDVLTNWYIRRSRDRFWAADGVVDEAPSTRSTPCSRRSCRVAAPLLPLTTEEVWRGLTGGRSVHLADWPSVDDLPPTTTLVAAMDQVREVCSAASALRKAAGLRVRLPLLDAHRRGRATPARSRASADRAPTR